MSFFRHAAILASFSVVAACSSGGGGSDSFDGPAWPKFRHDANNSGGGIGFLLQNEGELRGSVDLHGPITSSPSITNDGTVYVATESCTGSTTCQNPLGSLAAVNPDTIALKWTVPVQTNSTCRVDATHSNAIGRIISSPAVYSQGSDVSIFFGSEDGRVHAFMDASNATQPNAIFCFDPTMLVGPSRVAQAKFTSSPSFTVSSVSGAVDGVFIGSEIRTTNGDAQGRIYAIANDGSLRWEFPRLGQAPVKPITSSPAVSLGSIYFITDDSVTGDGVLYALSIEGNFKWSHSLGKVKDPTAPFAVSPIAGASGIFVATSDGTIIAFNLDGSERWRRTDPTHSFAGSLAISNIPFTPEPTETPTPIESPTPLPTATGGATASPTLTPTPAPFISSVSLFGVTKSGELVIYESAAPTPQAPTPQAIVDGEVIGSPALTADGLIVFASSSGSSGSLYVIDVLTGFPPATPTGTPSPAVWPRSFSSTGFRSSPSLATDGTIWIGGIDGKLYAIGTN